MARRNHELLTAAEREQLIGIPRDRDLLARLYTFEPTDLAIIGTRREPRNWLGAALQLALLRHPGILLAQFLQEGKEVPRELLTFVAAQLGVAPTVLADYAGRGQTMTDHARELATRLGMRGPSRADISLMINAAAKAAWATDKGIIIAAGVTGVPGDPARQRRPAGLQRAEIVGILDVETELQQPGREHVEFAELLDPVPPVFAGERRDCRAAGDVGLRRDRQCRANVGETDLGSRHGRAETVEQVDVHDARTRAAGCRQRAQRRRDAAVGDAPQLEQGQIESAAVEGNKIFDPVIEDSLDTVDQRRLGQGLAAEAR